MELDGPPRGSRPWQLYPSELLKQPVPEVPPHLLVVQHRAFRGTLVQGMALSMMAAPIVQLQVWVEDLVAPLATVDADLVLPGVVPRLAWPVAHPVLYPVDLRDGPKVGCPQVVITVCVTFVVVLAMDLVRLLVMSGLTVVFHP